MNLGLNADRFTGYKYLKVYDRFRPAPPVEIINQAFNYLNKAQAENVCDLGSGTGLSTKVWSGFATKIVGVEPSIEMLNFAKERINDSSIEFINGYGNDTKLASNSFDIVTCSQSFHWMEPKSTLIEIDRILKKNGVLVLYDASWPPTINYDFEKAYNDLFDQVKSLTSQLKEVIAHKWDKSNHLNYIKDSGHFKFTKISYYHKCVDLIKDNFIGIALSQGGLEALIKKGYSNQEIGIEKFIKSIESINDYTVNKMTYHYTAIYGIK